MKSILPFFILLTSCTSYKYVTFEHKKTTAKDTFVKVDYRFNNYDEIEITVSNQSSKAIWVDWERSGFVHNKQLISYYNNTAKISATTTTSSTGTRRNNTVNAETTGEVINDRPKEYVPAGTELKKTVKLGLPLYKNIFSYELQKERVNNNGSQLRYKTKKFSQENSPYRFYSLTTYFWDNAQEASPVIIDSFYVSEFSKTPQSPKRFNKVKGINPYRSSIRELTHGATALVIVGLAGLGFLLAGMN